MEKVTNVVADRINEELCSGSSSSSDSALKAESAEVVSRTTRDVELATVPKLLFDAMGDMDMKCVRRVLDTYFDDTCVFETSWDQPIVGRDNIYQFLQKLTERVPDAVRTVRHSRVVVDEAGNKAVKFKAFATGTYLKDTTEGAKVVPNASTASFINRLDESSITKKEIASIKESFAGSEDTASFSYLAHSATCWYLNEQGLVQHTCNHTKVLNMKPVALTGTRVKR
jgi:ketosteroid isomerase-like protein